MVADLTYVATWSGFVYVALVIDAFSQHRGRLAGRYLRCAPTWPWTPWRWPSGAARPSWTGWCTARTRATTCPSATPSASPRPARSPRSAPRRRLRQRVGRDHHWAVQDRTDPPARPLERHRRSRCATAGGSTGSTTAGSWSPLAMSPRPSSKPPTGEGDPKQHRRTQATKPLGRRGGSDRRLRMN